MCDISKIQTSDYNRKDSQTQRTNLWLPVGGGEGQYRGWGRGGTTTVPKTGYKDAVYHTGNIANNFFQKKL